MCLSIRLVPPSPNSTAHAAEATHPEESETIPPPDDEATQSDSSSSPVSSVEEIIRTQNTEEVSRWSDTSPSPSPGSGSGSASGSVAQRHAQGRAEGHVRVINTTQNTKEVSLWSDTSPSPSPGSGSGSGSGSCSGSGSASGSAAEGNVEQVILPTQNNTEEVNRRSGSISSPSRASGCGPNSGSASDSVGGPMINPTQNTEGSRWSDSSSSPIPNPIPSAGSGSGHSGPNSGSGPVAQEHMERQVEAINPLNTEEFSRFSDSRPRSIADGHVEQIEHVDRGSRVRAEMKRKARRWKGRVSGLRARVKGLSRLLGGGK